MVRSALSATLLLVLSGCASASTAPPSPASAASQSAAPAAGKTSPSASAQSSPGQQVHVLWGTSTGAQTFVRIAGEKGFFKQNGVNADAQYALASTAIAALVSGQAHFVVAGAVETIQAITSGAPLRMVAFNQTTNPYGIFSQPGIKTPKDLKGKTIAIGVKGDTSDISMRIALSQAGLDPDKDVNARTIGNSPARWAALSSGQIDAAILDEQQYTNQAKQQGMNILVSLSQQRIAYAAGGVEVNMTFAHANPEITLGVLKSLIQAGRFVQDPNNRQEVLAAMAKDLQRDPDDPLVADVYNVEHTKTPMNLPYPAAIETILTSLKGIDPGRYGAMTPDQVIDPSFMTTLKNQGFLNAAETAQ
jgi:ABC-type nitrate/sulfonate/bicarbonate transport system substrate-binding protein